MTKSGWRIFKKRVPFIRVRVNEDELLAFNNIALHQMDTPKGEIVGIKPVLQLAMTKVKCDEFPVGTLIGMSFGFSCTIYQYFTGKMPNFAGKLQVLRIDGQPDKETLAHA
ncbi:MAG: hypothetical protein EXS46_02785 [Candidatus Taylorbacteria bacterium]|nr:hypothetical protein [Candidatus Taylorbacteria bacterium]